MISFTRLYLESTENLIGQGRKGGAVSKGRNNVPILNIDGNYQVITLFSLW